jgi:hypothetical protein
VNPTNFAERAAIVTQYGIAVVPVEPRNKKTIIGATRATLDQNQIDKWNEKNPEYNCGAVGRKGGFWILDADRFVSLSEQIEQETGRRLDAIDTFMVQSSEGKRHLYFKHDARSEALGNFSVDDQDGEIFSVRAHNEYVVAPGSIHPKTGLAYEVIHEPTFGVIPVAPDWLMDWLEPAKKLSTRQKAAISTNPESTIPEGKRDEFLFAEACKLRDTKISQKAALAALREINNARCVPPMSESEVKTKITSAYTREARPKPTDVPHDDARSESSTITTVPPARPVLDEAAFYGLAGKIVKKIEPETESDPAGLLVELLVSFGNAIGRNVYYQIEDTKHFTNEFVVTVGRSSRARKGTGRNRIRAIMNIVDPEWLVKRNKSGIGSGEIIIHLIRDPRETWVMDKKTGNGAFVMSDRGVDDKRLCASMGEFQSILAACNRPDSQMSVVMRDGWDGNPLHNLVKNEPASCEKGHLSLMADTTLADLTVSLNQADRNNGFANRFLWVYVDRSKLLPEGGKEINWDADEMSDLIEAIDFGQHPRRIFMDELARKLWSRTMYPKLEREIPGIVGAITSRAASHTLRLAMLFALLDKSEHIRTEHLKAAAAIWQYCEDSAQTIFGELLSPEQSKIVEFLTKHGSATKKQIIHECFQRNRHADLIQADLDVLVSREKVTVKNVNDVPQYAVKRGS